MSFLTAVINKQQPVNRNRNLCAFFVSLTAGRVVCVTGLVLCSKVGS